MILTVHYGNFILRIIISLKVKVRFKSCVDQQRFGKQRTELISQNVASMLKMKLAACLFCEIQYFHSSCLFKLERLRSNDNLILQNYLCRFKECACQYKNE